MKLILVTLFLGAFGGYRFSKKQYGLGLIYLLSSGLFAIGWIYDVYLAFKEYFEAKATKNENTIEVEHRACVKKVKPKAIVATVLAFCFLLMPPILCSTFLAGDYDDYDSSSSWSETYGECITCGARLKRKYLYGSLCGKCYQKVQKKLD